MFATNQNPFSSAYFQSDLFGKGIFWGLFLLSLLTWGILIHKIWLLVQVRRLSQILQRAFSEKDPLGLQISRTAQWIPHPFFEIYKAMKQSALQLQILHGSTFFLKEDLELIEGELVATIEQQNQLVEKNLFILSTIATLAPFLGLLGTVWGILITFSQLQHQNSSMLSGLSLALTTTVAGLVIAIPALVGYNVLKHAWLEYRRQMETFAHRLITSLQFATRKKDNAKATAYSSL